MDGFKQNTRFPSINKRTFSSNVWQQDFIATIKKQSKQADLNKYADIRA